MAAHSTGFCALRGHLGLRAQPTHLGAEQEGGIEWWFLLGSALHTLSGPLGTLT